MKFQNPSFKIFLKGRTDAQTDARTSRKQYAPHFFKVGGIKMVENWPVVSEKSKLNFHM